MWWIGDDLGTNVGYARADGTAQCPENLDYTWIYWGFNTGQWVDDTTAKFRCRD